MLVEEPAEERWERPGREGRDPPVTAEEGLPSIILGNLGEMAVLKLKR